jgi:molybdopterin-containing oxidoreductase family iron-sulfur binding subunit
VPNVIRVGHHEDETSKLATWFVPKAHYLEYWGDGRSTDGTYVAQQPMILPLYGGWSDNDVLAKCAGLPKPTGPELVKDTFKTIVTSGDFDAAWNKFLHDGYAEGTSAGMEKSLFFLGAAATSFITEMANLPALSGNGNYEIVFTPDFHTYDGRYNNNGWLQEAPDPVTKLTWDNAALMSPATADALGIKPEEDGNTGTITIALENGAKVEMPALVAPGHANNSISISLGYGRTATGRVGTGAGTNVYPLRTSLAPYFVFTQNVKATGNSVQLAVTQHHFSMEGRAPVREGTLDTFNANPTFAKTMGMDEELPKAGNPSLYTHPPLTAQEQWGMAVDLNTCTGCNACVIACQAENNSPIVGKEQVINGREMHWMRMDRYFASTEVATDDTDPNPEMVFEPLMCQQCEFAPCETVCPVNATVHTPDGLNSMAYNRCIGTRYCANNCPYKVRRFNFFDYSQRPIQNHQLYLGPLTDKSSPDTIKMQKNPNVTVRMRGVMEKCTFCVQRIEEARIATKVKAGASDNVKIPVDSFQTACQQACPNEAITFGDITEATSKVSKLRASVRGYRLLEYLNTSPRVIYLAKLRNPNPRMPGADRIAKFEKEEKHESATEGGTK